MAINFFSENNFKFNKKRITSKWLKQVISQYQKIPGEVSFIFCSDDQLLEINKKFLKHFYYTDVITFNYNEGDIISGDIYISIDRIIENAKEFNETFHWELNRVMVHGVLHLLGFNDKEESERERMHELENIHLKELQ